jgi:hypothetical protein
MWVPQIELFLILGRTRFSHLKLGLQLTVLHNAKLLDWLIVLCFKDTDPYMSLFLSFGTRKVQNISISRLDA